MIAPNKHTAIEKSILYMAGLVMKELQSSNAIGYDELKSYLTAKVGFDVSEAYEYTLSFLFLLGKLKYDSLQDKVFRIIP